jgi:hypothetical protein
MTATKYVALAGVLLLLTAAEFWGIYHDARHGALSDKVPPRCRRTDRPMRALFAVLLIASCCCAASPYAAINCCCRGSIVALLYWWYSQRPCVPLNSVAGRWITNEPSGRSQEEG